MYNRKKENAITIVEELTMKDGEVLISQVDEPNHKFHCNALAKLGPMSQFYSIQIIRWKIMCSCSKADVIFRIMFFFAHSVALLVGFC